MGLVLTVAQSKSEFIPVTITTPSGEVIRLEVMHCTKRSSHILMRIDAPREFKIDREGRTPDPKFQRKKLERQKRLVSLLDGNK